MSSSGSVALLLTEASRTRLTSTTELEFRPRASLCLKCGQAAELCMPCSNRIAKGAVQLYRQARLEGSTNILTVSLPLSTTTRVFAQLLRRLWRVFGLRHRAA